MKVAILSVGAGTSLIEENSFKPKAIVKVAGRRCCIYDIESDYTMWNKEPSERLTIDGRFMVYRERE